MRTIDDLIRESERLIEISAQRWVTKMVKSDPVYRRWHAEYPGYTEDMAVRPIYRVRPGVILDGRAFCYLASETIKEAMLAWKWIYAPGK